MSHPVIRTYRRNTLASALLLAVLGLLLVACAGSSENLSVGDPAPEFSLPTASGETVALADYVGERPALLYFHMAMG